MKGLSKVLKVGGTYDVITKYKEIPVKAVLKLNWLEEDEGFMGFDWGRTLYKKAFSTLDPVYVKLSNDKYIRTGVFSNLGKELVLSFDSFVAPPEFVSRRSVRVEPDEESPVVVTLEFNGGRLTANAKDVSETGVGIQLDTQEDKDFIEFIKEKLEHLKKDELIEFNIKIDLPGVGTAEGKGKLRNVVGLGQDVYVRLGFEVNFPREEIDKIRKYVVNRQKEIIQALRFIG